MPAAEDHMVGRGRRREGRGGEGEGRGWRVRREGVESEKGGEGRGGV